MKEYPLNRLDGPGDKYRISVAIQLTEKEIDKGN